MKNNVEQSDVVKVYGNPRVSHSSFFDFERLTVYTVHIEEK